MFLCLLYINITAITFSSSLIHKILLDAHTAGKQFRVIVVDGRPWLEGKEQLRRLAKSGIECSYILINALSYVMPEVSIGTDLFQLWIKLMIS